jgi:hypothetical protein
MGGRRYAHYKQKTKEVYIIKNTRWFHYSLNTALLFGCFLPAHATDPDPSDAVLVVYELTSDQEDHYSNNDGRLSDFWSSWENDTDNKLDYVHELPATHGSGVVTAGNPETDIHYGDCTWFEPAFADGPEDAQLFIKGAWGEKGLYLLVEVIDDVFIGLLNNAGTAQELPPTENQAYKGAEQWMNDCFDMCMDKVDSDELKNHFISGMLDQVTYTVNVYQYRFGSIEPASIVRVSYVDPAWKECNVNNCWALITQQLSLVEAEQNYGVQIEVVAENSTRKAQEWLIPWKSISTGISKPATGSRTAATFQYNDMDGVATSSDPLQDLDVLFFKNRSSIYTHRAVNEDCGKDGNWGDIEYGGKLDDMVRSPMVQASVNSPQRGRSTVTGYTLFTVSGARVYTFAGGNAAPKVLVKQSVPGNGRLICEKILHK